MNSKGLRWIKAVDNGSLALAREEVASVSRRGVGLAAVCALVSQLEVRAERGRGTMSSFVLPRGRRQPR